MFGMLSVLAELQRELIIANTRDGLAAARLRGRNGGRPPKLNPEQRRSRSSSTTPVTGPSNRSPTSSAYPAPPSTGTSIPRRRASAEPVNGRRQVRRARSCSSLCVRLPGDALVRADLRGGVVADVRGHRASSAPRTWRRSSRAVRSDRFCAARGHARERTTTARLQQEARAPGRVRSSSARRGLPDRVGEYLPPAPDVGQAPRACSRRWATASSASRTTPASAGRCGRRRLRSAYDRSSSAARVREAPAETLGSPRMRYSDSADRSAMARPLIVVVERRVNDDPCFERWGILVLRPAAVDQSRYPTRSAEVLRPVQRARTGVHDERVQGRRTHRPMTTPSTPPDARHGLD